MRWRRTAVYFVMDIIFILPLICFVLIRRIISPKPFDIGIGPEPLVSYPYLKKALEKEGFTVRTFVNELYHITDIFDIYGNERFHWILRPYSLFSISVNLFKCLYLSFKGGPLQNNPLLWYVEPVLYRIAGIKIVMIPYGSDVQLPERMNNFHYKHVFFRESKYIKYTNSIIRTKIGLWTMAADYIVCCSEYMDFLTYWDTAVVNYLCIDTEQWNPSISPPGDPITILHAPNHRELKGTEYIISAVKELQEEGHHLNLILLENVPNAEVMKTMQKADLIIDQLILGSYGMFAIEGMAMGKPVISYFREDIRKFYEAIHAMEPGELPLISCTAGELKATLKTFLSLAYHDPEWVHEKGKQGIAYVEKYHSLAAIGAFFKNINHIIGVYHE